MQAPGGAQRGRLGNAELHHPDPSVRLDHAGELAHRRRPVVDITQQVRERERVEFAVVEGELFGLALHEGHAALELGALGQVTARHREHVLALVEADDLAAAPRQRERDEPSAGRDVEHALTREWIDLIDQGGAPPRILAEAEHGAHPVVSAREAGEQLERVPLALGRRGLR